MFHAALSPSEGGISRQLHVVELTVSSPHDPKHLISLVFFSQSFHTFYSTVSFPPRPTMFVHPLDHLYALRASLSFILHLKFPQVSPLLFYRNIVFFLTWEKKNDNTLALNRLCIKWFLICFPLTLSMRWRFNFNLFSFFLLFSLTFKEPDFTFPPLFICNTHDANERIPSLNHITTELPISHSMYLISIHVQFRFLRLLSISHFVVWGHLDLGVHTPTTVINLLLGDALAYVDFFSDDHVPCCCSPQTTTIPTINGRTGCVG